MEAVNAIFFEPGLRHLWWSALTSTFSEWALFSWVFFILVISSYVVSGGFFWVIDHFDLCPSYKIQKTRYPKNSDYWRCIAKLFWTYTFGIFPLSFLFPPVLGYLGVSAAMKDMPTLPVTLWHLFVCLVIEDFMHYVLHRALHHPKLYKLIHKDHHLHTYPFGLTAVYASPQEVSILSMATFAGPLLLQPHLSTIYLWIILRELDAVESHSGYDFPWHPSNFSFGMWGAVKFHDYHHESQLKNFASRFTVWDKLFGTYGERPENKDQGRKRVQ